MITYLSSLMRLCIWQSACICLSVCLQIKLTSCGQTLMKFSENVAHGIRHKLLDCGGDLDHHMDPGNIF